MKTLTSAVIFLCWFTMIFGQYNNRRLTTNNLDQSEPTIAIHPLGPNILMVGFNDFQDNNSSKPGYALSTDNGNNWSLGILPYHGYNYGFHPSCALDRSGHVFYGHIASAASLTPGPVYVSETPYNNLSWPHHIRVSNVGQTENDKPFIAVDNTEGDFDGRVYAAWKRIDQASGYTYIQFAYAYNYGSTFSNPITIASSSNSEVFSPMPAVGPNGELYVVWANRIVGTGDSLKVRKSTNGGASFGSTINITTFRERYSNWGGIDHFIFPSLSVDPSNGYVYLAYVDQVSSQPRVKFVRSTNGGSSWDSPYVIGNLGEKGKALPWLACDAYGKIAVTFMHHYSDQVDCYVVESYDHGASFRAPVKVTTVSSNPGYSSWFHNYQGMMLDNVGNNYVVWTDYRNGNADAYFAQVNTPPAAPTGIVGSIAEPTGDKHPRLDWSANLEADLSGYEIHKKVGGGSWALLATTANTYYVDETVTGASFQQYSNNVVISYKIRAKDLQNQFSDFSSQVDFNTRGPGQEKPISWKPLDSGVPGEFALLQNYPNPFNPVTTIQFSLKEAGPAEVAVYSIDGRKIATLVNEFMEAGTYQVQWDGKDQQGNPASSGVYLYQLKAGNQRLVKKMMLVR